MQRMLRPDWLTVSADWQITDAHAGLDRFHAVRHHSVMVERLRRILPVVAAALVGWIFLTGLVFQPQEQNFSVNTAILSTNSLVMEKPHLIGYLSDARSYEVTAQRAVQRFSTPNDLELRAIDATIRLSDDDWTTVNAPSGSYNRVNETLRLDRQIQIHASTGYKAQLKQAHVNLKTGAMVSHRPLTITSRSGTIDANAVEITDNGSHVRFFKGVHMRLNRGAPASNRARPAL